MNAVNLPSAQWSSDQIRSRLTERLRQAVGRSRSGPLSSAQQRLWFLDQLEPNSPRYNVPTMVRLAGELDQPALESSLRAIVARHDTLRTRFASAQGMPMQIVEEEVDFKIHVEDLSGFPEKERETRLWSLVREEIHRPFDLGAAGLFRASLFRMSDQEHLLILNLHHIICDEWSLKVLFQELKEFYQGFVAGRPISLPALPIQFADYARWQQQWLCGPICDKQLAYWKEHLKGSAGPIELPADRVPGSSSGPEGGGCVRPLGRTLSESLKDLAARNRVTLFMVLLAGFKALLYRYTRQEDIVVGTPFAGRSRLETEGLIGFFVNLLPLRTRLNGDMSFEQLLANVREVALGGYSHGDLPFDKLIETLHPDRPLTQTPILKMMFLLINPLRELRLGDLTLTFVDLGTETSKFDVTIGVRETDDGLVAGVEYRADLFDRPKMERLLEHYESVLQGAVARPDRAISELPLLSEEERRKLLIARSTAPAAETRWSSIQQWFEAQAQRSPKATAVTCENRNLTYGELNTRANQLAHHLRRFGVGPDTPVALLLERSVDMIVAILGVLKAGGAYVPMDPAYPSERLSFILEDTRAPVLLTTDALGRQLPPNQAMVISIDSGWEEIASESKRNPDNAAGGDDTAYIIYTSGSTGKPKGVLVTHRNVIRLFEQTEAWYGFGPADVWTMFHSYTFDFSVWEIWGALLYGGRLVIVPYLISRSPAEFHQLLSQEGVTVLSQTPSAFRQLLWADANSPGALPLKLRCVIFGGEALELQSLKTWFDRHGDEQPRLVNMYGITETTVHVTYRVIRKADLTSGQGSVIGVPIPDLSLYLLDERLQPVPVGVPGEICVGGAGVARGYLNRPNLNSQRFVRDPFSTDQNARMYRSGDLARYTSSGELEYLGRMDHQVKIRGFRVELGEIESTLNRHPHVRESVVIAADGPSGAKRLIAYHVARGLRPSAADLREHLARQVPDHMVPSVFMRLDELPLTSNGKVDRRALPPPADDESAAGRTVVGPRNSTEAALVETWQKILGRKSIGIHDNFFRLGGHSLLATQVIARLAAEMGIALPVRAIFEAPTVADLAEMIVREQHLAKSPAS